MGILKKLLIGAVLAGATLAATGCVSSLPTADPGVFVDGGYHVASSTTGDASNGGMPIYSSSDLQHWSQTDWVFRPGYHPGWADPTAGYWAPQLYYFSANGTHKYEAFYAGMNRNTGQRCIGRAYSASLGNFVDDGNPLCVTGGAYSVIDPSIFYDPNSGNGQHYLLYKDDLPSDRRIVIRTIDEHGNLQSVGPAHHILHVTQFWETRGWSSVEAPTMIFHWPWYYLFYSGGGFSNTGYGVGVAAGTSPIDNFDNVKDPANPILSSAGNSYCGVGGQDVVNNGSLIFYHAFKSSLPPAEPGAERKCTGGRFLGGTQLKWNSANWPYVDGGP
jgi:beta-xylosidase